MPDTTLSQALKEAYAAAPAGEVIHHTLEINHPAFTTPIRVVRDYTDLTATLEASAPHDPSTAVTFVGFNFDVTLPEVNPGVVPQVTIEIDNVDRSIVANIEAAMAGTDPITVIYREFLASDLSGPQNDPPLQLTILSIEGGVFRVRCTAGFPDLQNRRFPTTEYDAQTFPGLLA